MIALDTNIVSLLLRRKLLELPDNNIYIPYAVEAELKYGVAIGGNPEKHLKIIEQFFCDKQVTLSAGLTKDIINEYVRIRTHLKKNGTPISPNDLWIAAECVHFGLSFMTRDKDFDYVPQLSKVML